MLFFKFKISRFIKFYYDVEILKFRTPLSQQLLRDKILNSAP
ncbi:hypothetical protein CAMGR0001_1839 [Campylobacter gracilis RM3268]|uniref:Uncharacterized protein n=1 Tax=Campylobacter gracilis RM3268 TaxID=553220 RepID=C8PED8_9BACT|nr:hypothetical protein CAMGR0001_1839 [Campylobacter gracilis RM3268]